LNIPGNEGSLDSLRLAFSLGNFAPPKLKCLDKLKKRKAPYLTATSYKMKHRSVSTSRLVSFVKSSRALENKSNFDEPPRRRRLANRLSSTEDHLTQERVMFKQHTKNYTQPPDELFAATAAYSPELRDSVFKGRIAKDHQLLAVKEEHIRTYRSILAHLLNDKTYHPDLTLLDRLKKLPKTSDELDTIVSQKSPKKAEETNVELVLFTMHKQISSLKTQVTSLEEYNAELSKSNISLQKKSSLQFKSAKKVAVSSRKDNPQLTEVKSNKLVELVSCIALTHMSSETISDLWELDSKALQLLKADRAQIFRLDRAKGAFVTFNGRTQLMLSVKNSLLTTAYSQKQIMLVPDNDVSFDNKITALFGGGARQLDLLPILSSTSDTMAVLVVLRRSYVNMMSELVLIGTILAAALEMHEFKVSSNMYQMALNLTLKACDMLYHYSDFSDFISNAAMLTTELVRAKHAQLLMVNEDRGELFRRVKQGGAPDKYESFPLSMGIAGFCATKKTPVITSDMHSHRLFTAEVDDPRGLSKSALCVPLPALEADAKVQAVLVIADKLDGKDFTAQDCELLKLFGSVLIRVAENVQ
jgi:hypothetical protein